MSTPVSRDFSWIESAGSESGRPRGGSVRTARAFVRWDVISDGPAMAAMPQVGEPLFPRPQAARTSTNGKSLRCIACNLTLIGPNARDGDRSNGRQGLRYEVVDVVQDVGR